MLASELQAKGIYADRRPQTRGEEEEEEEEDSTGQQRQRGWPGSLRRSAEPGARSGEPGVVARLVRERPRSRRGRTRLGQASMAGPKG